MGYLEKEKIEREQGMKKAYPNWTYFSFPLQGILVKCFNG
jgi:hypothetical protein